MALQPDEEWARRVLAALELADIRGSQATPKGPDRVRGLAEALQAAGLSHGQYNNVRTRLNKASRKWKRDDLSRFLEHVAAVCDGVPVEFFYVDLEALRDVPLPQSPNLTPELKGQLELAEAARPSGATVEALQRQIAMLQRVLQERLQADGDSAPGESHSE